MKPILKRPRFDLAEPAVWCAGFGLICLIVQIVSQQGTVFIFLLGAVYLALAIGIWQEMKAAVVSGGILFSLGVVSRTYGAVTDYSWSKIGSGLLFAWLAFRLFSSLRRWGKDDSEETPTEGEENPAMISIVLLLAKPRFFEESILAHIVEEAWGGDYTNENEDLRDGFVTGSDPYYLVKSDSGIYSIHNHDGPYFDDLDSVARGIGELRLRSALLEHRAWLAVDLISPADESQPRESLYPAIIRLIYELADESVLVVFRPETGTLNLWSDDVLEALLMPSGEDRFSRVQVEVPVIRVDSTDEAMARAVVEARKRWNEFVTAFQQRGKEDTFSVKAPITVGDNTEFIWVEVDGIASGVIFGKLGNRPVSLKGLDLGSPVAVPLEEINDWCYTIDGGPPVGLFTLAAVNEAERRFREERGETD